MVCFFYLKRCLAILHPCIQDASGQRDAAEQIAADRLPTFLRKHTDRICGRVRRCSISSFLTAGLRSRVAVWIPRWSRQ